MELSGEHSGDPLGWAFEDAQWTEVRDPRIDASIRIVPAARLLEPDSCMREAAGILVRLFGAVDVDALGGTRSVTALYCILRQLASTNDSVPVILKAIRRPVNVLVSTGQEEYLVRPARTPRMVPGPQPRLILYHSGRRLIFPKECLGWRREPLQIVRPDPRYRTTETIEVRDTARTASRRSAYSGVMRSLCLHPDTYTALARGATASFSANGPSLNVIRLCPRPGLGSYESVRFGINFTACGTGVTDVWVRRSDFREFLDVYPRVFGESVGRLLTIKR